MTPPTTFDAQTLAAALGGVLSGENRPVTALVPPPRPYPGGVMVINSRAELELLGANPEVRQLGALVAAAGLGAALPCPTIAVAHPRIAFAQLTALFAPAAENAIISDSAIIDASAVLAADVSVGSGTVIAAGVRIGAGPRIGAGCIIGENCVIGENCRLYANVTLYREITLGARVSLHSGVVLGADGFGYAFGAAGAVKIHHLGTVVLEDDVEIGANSCVDRATLGETRIGARCKIDNLCQIGHNVVMGSDCIVAGGAAIGGSTVFGRGVFLGGSVAVIDHVRLGAGARIGGRSSVTKSVPAGESWGGYPAKAHRKWARELHLLGQLEGVLKRLKDD